MFSLSVSSVPPSDFDDEASLGPPTTFVEIDACDHKLVPGPPRMPRLSKPPPTPGIGVLDREMDRPGWSIPLVLAAPSIRCRVSRRPTTPARTQGVDLTSLRPSIKPTVRPATE
jgi:hypothetical protein